MTIFDIKYIIIFHSKEQLCALDVVDEFPDTLQAVEWAANASISVSRQYKHLDDFSHVITKVYKRGAVLSDFERHQ